MTTAVVGGALANKAGFGGEAWVRMSWVAGLRRLGLDTWFVEDIDSATCTDASVRYFLETVAAFGLSDRALLRVDRGKECYGAGADALAALAADAALVINIGGHLPAAALFPAATRVYVDIDPGWTQFWHAAGERAARLDGHDAFYTIAENIGTPQCALPTNGIPWRPIRQPVVLDDWPRAPAVGACRFTTVATWRNCLGPAGDGRFGGKHHEFRRVVDLPRHSAARFEVALRIDAADGPDRDLLERHGWHLVDPDVVGTPHEFRDYVQGSDAEFSPAQGVYAQTASGWFSDRSVRYLASGRPVLVQDTGLAAHLPVDEGIVTFDSLDAARAGAARILRDYDAHAGAARAIAEEYFASDLVLGRLLDEVGVA